jgi:hypothetical protein
MICNHPHPIPNFKRVFAHFFFRYVRAGDDSTVIVDGNVEKTMPATVRTNFVKFGPHWVITLRFRIILHFSRLFSHRRTPTSLSLCLRELFSLSSSPLLLIPTCKPRTRTLISKLGKILSLGLVFGKKKFSKGIEEGT